MLRMPHLPLMRWDCRDQLLATAQQVVNNKGVPETTWYVYDAAGQRMRKVTERAVSAQDAAKGTKPARMKERIYVGGFELYREYKNDGTTITLERDTLHISDDKQRIALVETKTPDSGLLNRLRTFFTGPETLIRYQFGNHLGSASLELDQKAQIISYEEYAPHGSSTYQAVRSQTDTAKRYRYTGKERDEESGLYYHGARYYMPWLGRWATCDPKPSTNLFSYGANNPITFNDPDGKAPACEGQPGCELTSAQRFEAAKRAFEMSPTDLVAATDLQSWKDARQEENYELEQQKQSETEPSRWESFKSWAAAKYQSAADWVSDTKPAKTVAEVNESLRETARNVGAEQFDSLLGGLQRGKQGKLGSDATFYETPAHMGAEVGDLTYEAGRDAALGKAITVLAGAIIPLKGGKFKAHWNKQELQAAEFVWKTEGKLWRREAEIWLMKEGKLVKTKRRLDALLFDVTTGEIEAAEWSTAKNLSEGAAKKAQLEYQKELFEKAEEGWTILARPSGEDAFYDITKAAQRTEPYPHWRKPK